MIQSSRIEYRHARCIENAVPGIVLLLVLAFSIHAAGPDDPLNRQDVIKNVRQEWVDGLDAQAAGQTEYSLPPEVLAELRHIITKQNEFSLRQLQAKIRGADPALSQRARQQRAGALVQLYTLHNVNNGEALAKAYRMLSPQLRITIYGLLRTSFHELVDDRYQGLAKAHVSSLLQLAQDAKTRPDAIRMSSLFGDAADFYATVAGSSGAKWLIAQVRQADFDDAEIRFNLVAPILSLFDEDAMPLAVSYFKNHAFRPHELQMVVKYFDRTMEETEWKSKVFQKQQMLQRSIEVLREGAAMKPEKRADPHVP